MTQLVRARTAPAVIFVPSGGLFARGRPEACLRNHFIDCLNVTYVQDDVRTRPGSLLSLTLPGIKRFYIYKRTGEVPRLILLDNTGKFWDSTNLITPIMTIPGATDFAMTVLFNNAYISPHNGLKGLPGESIYVYRGSGGASPIGGTAPTGGQLGLLENPALGKIAKGHRVFGVAYETSTGFITSIGYLNTLVCSGLKQVDISNIPLGGPGVIARHIVSTLAISDADWTGNLTGFPFFFVPRGLILNNIDTTLTVDFYDSELVSSADYLLSELATVPAGVFLFSFEGRLVSMGEDANEAVIRISKAGEPESHSATDGFKIIDPGDGLGLRSGINLRGSLLLHKAQRSYQMTPGAGPPSSWEYVTLDSGIGTESHGLSVVLDSGGVTREFYLIADRSGILSYNGAFSPVPLTWKVDDVWLRINLAAFHKVQIAIDPINQLIYCGLPLDGAIENSHLLVGDYENGFGQKSIRWSLYKFPIDPISIVVDVDPVTGNSMLKYGSTNVYEMNELATDDFGNAINSFFETAPITPSRVGEICQFQALRYRVIGNGLATPQLFNVDRGLSAFQTSLTLANNPNADYHRLANFVTERMVVRFGVNAVGDFFILNNIVAYSKPLWSTRPQ